MYFDQTDEITKLHNNMEHLFNRLLRANPNFLLEEKANEHNKNLAKLNQGFRMPVGNIQETETKVIATFEMPGLNKNNIDLNVTDNFLEVKGQEKHESENTIEDKYRYQSQCSNFYRQIKLPAEVDPQTTKATFNNGLLRVEMPKLKEKPTNKIKIE